MATTIDTPGGIKYFALLQCIGRLKIECQGLRFRGPATSTLVKAHYGLRGNRESLLKQLEEMRDTIKAADDMEAKALELLP